MKAALVSAAVSILIVIVDRYFFHRSDIRRSTVRDIKQKLVAMKNDPPWSTNGENVYFEKVRETAALLDLEFEELWKCSFPWQNRRVRRAWVKFRNIEEDEWKSENANRKPNYDSLTKDEFLQEVDKVLRRL